MSRLRAKCPDCRTYTAVAIGPEYQCHSCGREWAAGLVRVPNAWGSGGESMAEAGNLPLDYPEAALIEEDSLVAQTLAVAAELPDRPLILGGCCCSHVGAVEGLAARHDKLAVVWFDAHGDLNTPETSPSGNAWGMPLRMIVDGGAVDAVHVALIGARNLDAPEVEFIRASGIRDAAEEVLGDVDCVYVAFDLDVLDPAEARPFMPEPAGMTVDEAEASLRELASRATIVGAGFTGGTPDPENIAVIERLAAALGL
ncbi:MAG: arginase [Gaiellaceae bacterium]|nr:arginase [Gaiellaceae bacterium]